MILDEIIAKKIESVNKRKEITPKEVVYKKAMDLAKKAEGLSLERCLLKKNLTVIGEFKKASPSKGIILKDFDVYEIFNYYSYIGVDAFSVLTEEEFFLGKDEYLEDVKKYSNLPILRKDFIVDTYQIYESKALGANVILLIVAALKDRLKEFYDIAKICNLEVLVEVHNKEELDIALECDCKIIGINNRNLKNFETSLDKTKELIKYIPKDKLVISESGISSIEDLESLRALGVNGVLIGELFMRNMSNEEFIQNYREFRFYYEG